MKTYIAKKGKNNKMKIRHYILLFILNILFGIKSFAQVYPIQINTQLIPPYSLKLSDYVTPGANRLGVTMLLTDLNEPQYQVRLELPSKVME